MAESLGVGAAAFGSHAYSVHRALGLASFTFSLSRTSRCTHHAKSSVVAFFSIFIPESDSRPVDGWMQRSTTHFTSRMDTRSEVAEATGSA